MFSYSGKEVGKLMGQSRKAFRYIDKAGIGIAPPRTVTAAAYCARERLFISYNMNKKRIMIVV